MRKVLVAVALILVGLAACLPEGVKPHQKSDLVVEDKLNEASPISSAVQVNKADVEEVTPVEAPTPAPIEQPHCEMDKHRCTNNKDLECDKDDDCGHKIKVHEAEKPHVPKKGCDQSKGVCYLDSREECKVDVDCDNYKCKDAPSQWIALVLAMSPFAPLGAAFAYISRWGLMALYLNATFLPCVISCILVCCFQPKLEDEAYRMPTAVWIMVFWGVMQAILYIWAVWVFGENGFDAGGDFEGCLLRDNWNW